MEPGVVVPSVPPSQAQDMVAAGAVLVDIREAHEWAGARIPGATWLPMSAIDDWYPDLPTDGEILVYCHSGHRSRSVVRALVEQAGLDNVFDLTGGIVAWDEAGLPVDVGPLGDG
jgi:rhodanese-related sulfurtransferase